MTHAQYFFPAACASAQRSLCLKKFPVSWASLAATYHNVFYNLLCPSARAEYKDTFHIFPAMMIFRHAVELLLKAIIKDVCSETPPNNVHSLKKLFEICKNANFEDKLEKDLPFVEKAVDELQNADNGQAFRYPLDKEGNEFLPMYPEVIDADQLFKNCEKLWGALWNVHGPVT